MANMNLAVLIGRIGNDLELRYTGGGTPVLELSVATSRFSGKGQERKEETDWHDVVVFGKTAEYLIEHARKGDTVAVRGNIRVRTFERRDGSKGRAVEILADQVELFGRNGNAQQGAQPPPAARPRPGPAGQQPSVNGGPASPTKEEPEFDDDIPF